MIIALAFFRTVKMITSYCLTLMVFKRVPFPCHRLKYPTSRQKVCINFTLKITDNFSGTDTMPLRLLMTTKNSLLSKFVKNNLTKKMSQ